MPVQYTTIVEEHVAVRQRVGLFDISHMGRLTFEPKVFESSTIDPTIIEWLERVTTNQVARLADHQIQYSLMTDEHGGVIDDILVYRQPFAFLVVCNASNRGKVVEQFERHHGDAAGLMRDRTQDTAMIAVQGPKALETLQPLFDQPLERVGYYHLTMGQLQGRDAAVISRTGYTGEDGFEVIVSARSALETWNALMESGKPHGILPCGLGARDTLRLEAGMPLYGHELSETIDPFSAGVSWAVKLGQRGFRRPRDPALQERGSCAYADRTRAGRAPDRPARRGRAGGRPRSRPGHVRYVLADLAGQHRHGIVDPRIATSEPRSRWKFGDIASPHAWSSSPSTSESRKAQPSDQSTTSDLLPNPVW